MIDKVGTSSSDINLIVEAMIFPSPFDSASVLSLGPGVSMRVTKGVCNEYMFVVK